MKQFLYRLTPARVEMVTVGPTPEEAALVGEHFAYLESLTERGVMILVGRTQDNSPDTIGLAIFQAASDEDARAIMENDPAVKNGVMLARLFPFKIALHGQWPEAA